MLYGYVYGLYDPQTNELRYIGQTTMLLWRRLACHLSPSVLARPSHRTHWLQGLLDRSLRPTIKPLAEATSKEELDCLEVQHIAAARERGERLVNLEPGGNTPSLEHRAKLAALKRGVPRTAETKAKISASKKGRKLSAAHREKVVAVLRAVDHTAIPHRVGSSHHAFRHDITTEYIVGQLKSGRTKVEVARDLGVSPTFVHRRIREHREDLSLAKQKQRQPQ